VESSGSKEKILIVDDEESIRSLFVEALSGLGYRCDVAENGLECLKKYYESKDYDVVLLDIQMPELGGIETLKKLKSYSPDISVLIVSASRDIDNVRAALKEGAYDYIFKPFNVNDVEAVIRRAVERARLIKENRDYQLNLEKKVEYQTLELVKLYTGTLQAMIMALDLRESETGYHSYRVTEYALTLGKYMNLSGPELSVLAKGALLHDIGKIGVPDHILLKPGKLTDEEWNIMRKHAELGHGMLIKIEFLEESADIVFMHHEHFDGSGYPGGLSGEEIPLGARIFSIVDAMDAMTSKRVYRKEIPFDEAIERIKEASGAQFDPAIVDVFVKIDLGVWEDIKNNINDSGSTFLKGLLFELSKYRY